MFSSSTDAKSFPKVYDSTMQDAGEILPTDGAVVQVGHGHGWSARSTRGVHFHLVSQPVI